MFFLQMIHYCIMYTSISFSLEFDQIISGIVFDPFY